MCLKARCPFVGNCKPWPRTILQFSAPLCDGFDACLLSTPFESMFRSTRIRIVRATGSWLHFVQQLSTSQAPAPKAKPEAKEAAKTEARHPLKVQVCLKAARCLDGTSLGMKAMPYDILQFRAPVCERFAANSCRLQSDDSSRILAFV